MNDQQKGLGRRLLCLTLRYDPVARQETFNKANKTLRTADCPADLPMGSFNTDILILHVIKISATSTNSLETYTA